MYRNIFIASAYVMFALFASPSMSATGNQPIQSGPEEQAFDLTRVYQDKRGGSQSIASKRAEAMESAESVDCFYDANRASPDCVVTESGRP